LIQISIIFAILFTKLLHLTGRHEVMWSVCQNYMQLWLKVGRGRVFGDGARIGTRDRGREIGDAGTWDRGRENGDVRTWDRDACYIEEKRKKVAINGSKKLISFNETAQTAAIFPSIRIDLPITYTFLSGFLDSLNCVHWDFQCT